MTEDSKLPKLTAPICLTDPCASRLAELAEAWNLSLHEAAQAAIHFAYLDHLEWKMCDAANEHCRLRSLGCPDDELPFLEDQRNERTPHNHNKRMGNLH